MAKNALAKGGCAYPVLPDGQNTKYMQVILATHEIAQNADINNVESLYACLDRYIRLCRDFDMNLTNTGAYQACGITRRIVDGWANGTRRAKSPEYKKFAQFIRDVCSEYREILMAEGKINPVTGIWWQKNYDGFSDQPPVIAGAATDEEALSAEEVREKYAGLPEE